METADMVVMGAGVMGTSIAFHLAERGAERVVLCLSLGLVLALSAGACRNRTDGTVQYPDDSFVVPDGGEPRYARDQGPTVGIDEAHRNYHTADDRYRSFANLLRDDGYRVGRFAETFTRDALGNIDVLVISNALSAEKDKEWSLPTPPAFTEEEVDVVTFSSAWAGISPIPSRTTLPKSGKSRSIGTSDGPSAPRPLGP